MAHDLLADYYPVAVFVILAIVFPFVTYLATRLLRRDNPTPLKLTTYECGEVPEGEASIQFSFEYYLYAIMFLVFDVAAIFLILFGLVYRTELAGVFGDGAALLANVFVLLFALILTAAVLYSLRKEEGVPG